MDPAQAMEASRAAQRASEPRRYQPIDSAPKTWSQQTMDNLTQARTHAPIGRGLLA